MTENHRKADRIPKMINALKSVKLIIGDSNISPVIYRESCFLIDNFRYVKRKIFHPNEWRNRIREPLELLGFNVTDVCNANCCYCAYKFDKPEGVMEMQIYKKGIQEFSKMGGGMVGLGPITGEPLLDPHLTERIEFATQFKNIKGISFYTNGILLKKEKIRRDLIQLSSKIRININISLPGFEKEMFERVYNVKWDEAILHGIKNLLQENEEAFINLGLQPDRGGVLKERNFRTYILPYIDKKNISLPGSRIRDNWCGQIKEDHLTGDMVLRKALKIKNIPCKVLLDRHIDILVNGDVRMCGCRYGKEGKHDELVIGNIKEKSLSEIWFGSEPKKICENFLKSEVPTPCQECLMYCPY